MIRRRSPGGASRLRSALAVRSTGCIACIVGVAFLLGGRTAAAIGSQSSPPEPGPPPSAVERAASEGSAEPAVPDGPEDGDGAAQAATGEAVGEAATGKAATEEPPREEGPVPTPGGRLTPEQIETYRELLTRVTSDSSEVRVAAILELGRMEPRVRKVAELLRQFAWQNEMPDERDAARAALLEMGVELGEPPKEEGSWLANFSKKTLLKTVRNILETMQTPNPDRDVFQEYDRRFERQREMSEIGEEEEPR